MALTTAEQPTLRRSLLSPFTAAMIIPTGVGAAIGGFGGDATPQLNLLASVCDTLITHPNVANAAMFQKLPDNALYVEGYALDRFFEGTWHLQPVRKNRIGVVIDAGIEPRMKTLHINTLNAVKAVYGVDIISICETDTPVRTECGHDASGASTGTVKNPYVLLKACERLIQQGATAIALCIQMPTLSETAEATYKSGEGVDPVGGIEALLSHLVVSTFQIPCAHTPVFTEEDAQLEFETVLEPRTAAEFITATFLPCVLTGLSRAPQITDSTHNQTQTTNHAANPHSALSIHTLDALVMPANCLGSVPVLACLQESIPIIAVEENTTVMNLSPKALLQIERHPTRHNLPEASPILTASNYFEAAGILQALKCGLPTQTQNTRKKTPQLPPQDILNTAIL